MTMLETIPASGRENRETIYGRVFWLSYLANVMLVTANALTFRFAEWVKYLGGQEQMTGTLVSVGVLTALTVRIRLGQDIDGLGVRRTWLGGTLLFVVGCTMFLLANELSWELFVARIAFAVGLAAMFTSSIVFIQNQVPPERRTEVLGNLGSSGFIGMITGALLSDLILDSFASGRWQFVVLFGSAAALGLGYFVLVVCLTWNETHRRPAKNPPLFRLAMRYWPGWVVLVAMMMGVSFVVTTVFLTRFSTVRGLGGIGTFFFGYCVSAFVFRLITRRWSKTIGRHKMILCGLAGHAVGHALLPLVTSEWMFLGPAAACGFGHALLFPAVVSLGAGSFPVKYRGSGTTLVLGFIDIGSAVSSPVLGGIIDRFDGEGFTEMFLVSSGTAVVIGVLYALTAARKPDADLDDVADESALVPPDSQLTGNAEPVSAEAFRSIRG